MATNRIETLDPALIRPGTASPSAEKINEIKSELNY